ncbi:MAG: hypothetical protein IT324_32420 [Anaerolineae bacterium]|nr:hypothetical protein [Anaerolineae bacterium]
MDNQPAPTNNRWRIIWVGIAVSLIVLTFAACRLIALVVPLINVSETTATPYFVITGTIQQIAGMPVPAGAVITGQAVRSSGGTFDFTTNLRPQQIYEFYYGYLTQKGIWQAGTQPIITENSAEFQFRAVIPRLTIVTATCDSTICNVHVDY